MEFKEKLKILRKSINIAKPMSQSDLADKSGIDQTVISLYESGKRKPSLKNIIRLADALNCSADELIS